MQNVGGRAGSAPSSCRCLLFRCLPRCRAMSGRREVEVRRVLRQELRQAAHQRLDVVVAGHVHARPCRAAFRCTSARRRSVAISCSMNSGWPSSSTSTAFLPAQNCVISSGTSGYTTLSARIGMRAGAERVGEAERLQREHQAVVEAALHDDAERVLLSLEDFVEPVLGDELARRGQPHVGLELLLPEDRRRMRQAVVDEFLRRPVELLARRDGRRQVLLGDERLPRTWHARMRSSIITGVFEASDSSKPCSTISTIFGELGPRVEQPHRATSARRRGCAPGPRTPPSP